MRRCVVPFALLAALVSGCAPTPAPKEVTGTVYLDDVPLAGAHVEFVPKEDISLGAFGAVTDEQGNFKADIGGPGRSAKAGVFVVLVTKGAGFAPPPPPAKAGSEADEARTKELMKQMAPGTKAARGTLPGRYAHKETSPFEVTVNDGATQLEPLRLESGKVKK